MTPFEVVVQIIAMALIAVSLAGLIVFMVTYARHAHWRSTPPGRAIMYLATSVGLVLALTIINAFVGPYFGAEILALAVLAVMAFTIWRLVYVLYTSLKIDPFFIFRIRRSPTAKEKREN